MDRYGKVKGGKERKVPGWGAVPLPFRVYIRYACIVRPSVGKVVCRGVVFLFLYICVWRGHKCL